MGVSGPELDDGSVVKGSQSTKKVSGFESDCGITWRELRRRVR